MQYNYYRVDVEAFRCSKSQKKVYRRISTRYQLSLSWREFQSSRNEQKPVFSVCLVTKEELLNRYSVEQLFSLCIKYQDQIHKDAQKWSIESFYDFVIESVLDDQNIDDALVALSTIDILPDFISSCYFIYDPDFSHLSLGIFSALMEIELACFFSKKYYTLGIYVA